MHRINPYTTRNSIIELLCTQRKPQGPYITLKYKSRPGKNHTCYLTTYQSSTVCFNATEIANLLEVEAIISKSGFQASTHADICMWAIIRGVQK